MTLFLERWMMKASDARGMITQLFSRNGVVTKIWSITIAASVPIAKPIPEICPQRCLAMYLE
jgi:hypothetical protein